MIKIKEAVVVEGKYDKMRVQALFDTAVIETGGFRVFKDSEKRAVLRELAQKRGMILLTDSDGAGLLIRSYLKGVVGGNVKQAYVPEIEGKEKRKRERSKQGLLGVEGMTDEIIMRAVLNSGATVMGEDAPKSCGITKGDLYELGLSGRDNSAALRARLLEKLRFPRYMTANAMLAAIDLLYSKDELERLVEEIKEDEASSENR